jgi:hypothetical protein
MFNNELPYIIENFKILHCYNPMSNHRWTEQGKTTGYTVRGGGWLPTKHRTLKGAEKELQLRNQILQERKERLDKDIK